VSAAAAAAAEVPLLAAVWLGTVDGSRVVGVAFLDSATRWGQDRWFQGDVAVSCIRSSLLSPEFW